MDTGNLDGSGKRFGDLRDSISVASRKIILTPGAMPSISSLVLASWKSMNTRLLREAVGFCMVNPCDYGFYVEILRESQRLYISLNTSVCEFFAGSRRPFFSRFTLNRRLFYYLNNEVKTTLPSNLDKL